MKKVLLVIVDALASRVVVPAIADGRLPTLARLAKDGVLHEECTSVFPSITPAATASLATGCYPAEHGIAGAFWYERDLDRVAYYGDDVWVLINEGLGQYFDDFLVKLNYERLKSATIFERVEKTGLTAGVLDFMWFRGDCSHEVNAPLLLKLLPGVEFADKIKGPRLTAMGDFVTSLIPKTGEPLTAAGGLMRRFGFHDETTADYLLQLADVDGMPDFTLAYFPNNDYESHAHGPQEALTAVERVDEILGTFIERLGGFDRCLENLAIIITGDHSQSDMAESKAEQGIDLNATLERDQIVPAGKAWGDNDELMVCPNLRAAQIYFRKPPSDRRREEVVRQVLTEPRVDQVLWLDSEPTTEECRYRVWTSDRGQLAFRAATETAEANGTDEQGNAWIIEGDLAAIDARINSDNKVVYGDYPNAMERIANAFCQDCGDVWMTARVGSEFCLPETSVHPGGWHGSLHALDSTSPFIAGGLPDDVSLPRSLRTVDVAPLCLAILGIEE